MLIIECKMDILADAAAFYAKALEIDDYLAEVEILLLDNANLDGYCGDCENGCYEIGVTGDGLNTLVTLAHEFVHLAQYLSGRMRDISKQRILFLDKVYNYDMNDPLHTELPFEREAYEQEQSLMIAFIKWYHAQGKI